MLQQLICANDSLSIKWANIQQQWSDATLTSTPPTHSPIYLYRHHSHSLVSTFPLSLSLNNIRNSFCHILCPICVLFTHPYDWPPSAAISAPQDSWAWPSLLHSLTYTLYTPILHLYPLLLSSTDTPPIPSTIILSPQSSTSSLPVFLNFAQLLPNNFCHPEKRILLTVARTP